MFETEAALDAALSEPTAELVAMFARIPGDILLLGAAGKMGPSLARMAKRAAPGRRIIAVSRFTSGDQAAFTDHGIETIACDLLDEEQVAKLPDAPNIVHMTGRKFGSSGDASTTWAVNCLLPAIVCRRFRTSRIVAFSTGNVYPFFPTDSRGPSESEPLNPVGEYGMSALGRERVFEHFSKSLGIPVAIIRLNYAVDLRYGVLVDIARKVFAGEPVDATMGHFNAIWQGDANAMTLRAFEHCTVPPRVFNLTGPRVTSVRAVAERFGELFGKPAHLIGTEAPTALISDARAGIAALGPLRMTDEELIERVAAWVQAGGRSLNKPTHFEVRSGKY